MKSGSVTGNTSEMPGAGIFAYVYDGPINISISGGTIEDNISTVADIGHAIGLYGYEGSLSLIHLYADGFNVQRVYEPEQHRCDRIRYIEDG